MGFFKRLFGNSEEAREIAEQDDLWAAIDAEAARSDRMECKIADLENDLNRLAVEIEETNDHVQDHCDVLDVHEQVITGKLNPFKEPIDPSSN